MKILVTGATGQLGHDCVLALRERGHEVRGVSSRECPLTDERAVHSCIEAFRPNAVIHAAAYTAVDKAEDEPALCMAVNATGTEHVAAACRAAGATLLYISTDYVFPGTGTAAYEVGAEKGPLNVYGKSKLAGEEAVMRLCPQSFIVRISWVFGIGGKNFIRTMLKLAETHEEVSVVDDQVGSPTYTRDLSNLLADMIETRRFGIYHATNEGFCSWAEVAAEAFRQAGRKTRVIPVPSTAYPTKAKRPRNSRLKKDSLDRANFSRLPRWKDAIGRYLIELSEARGLDGAD
ncbi:dTDP-4-dehydrorhamnose reductase [Mitsuokella sp. oral taxon 131]|uniref:dTDP-4-dehydrorhamnose reductase n=1 Tax=Mitsuokella sp. oral taxon 131 TaxID=1321780 RepID=UPI0003AE7B2E|nr:dTDP-4-dehydrorhamnose reductase [Mitsuokella sp. oral taxon 131]ERL04913.1 dTDP-4-dehydrorhamnose reductase [Mitsuokella sp. oral taxon 131 str. W9106]